MKIWKRWAVRTDMPQIVAIAQASLRRNDPCDKIDHDMIALLKMRDMVAFVATTDPASQYVVAYLFYRFHNASFEIVELAVAQDKRRQGIGMFLVNNILSKVSSSRRRTTTVMVNERFIHAQLMFRKLKFNAIRTIRRHFGDDDAIEMEYSIPARQPTDLSSAGHPAEI